MPTAAVPSRSHVVIVGGGITGLSTAYHLALNGWTDVVVLERDQLTSGTTWHAAGLVVSGGLGDETMVAMFRRSQELYAHLLTAETGAHTGYAEVGYLQAAVGAARAEGLRRDAAFQRYLGIEVHEVSPTEVAELWPMASIDDVTAGFHFPRQGRVNPVDAAMALAAAARAHGVRILEGVEVTGVTVRDGAVTGVRTASGEVEAEHVVNCAGLWARAFGLLAGVDVPLQAAEHYYMITEQIPGLSKDTPVLEDGSRYAYFREEVGGMLVGLFEPVARVWHHDESPRGPFLSLEPDWERILPYLGTALGRLRGGHELGIHTFFCGPESFTPDVHMLLGEAPNVRNYWVLAGMNSLGILLGGGAGEQLAHWMVSGRPQVDVTGIELARFGPWANDRRFLSERVVEQLGMLFGDSMFPYRRPATGRALRVSPVHQRLVEAGARFMPAAEWEFVEWFDVDATLLASQDGFEAQPWQPYAAQEHWAVRSSVGLFDMSLMSRIEVSGADAPAALQLVSCSDVDVPVGRVVYTMWLDDRGHVIADLTITRTAEDEFLLVCGPEHHTRVMSWLDRHTSLNAAVSLTDITADTALFSLQGPRARQVLGALTDAPLSPDRWPHLWSFGIEVAGCPARASRVTYVGELGYELIVSANHAVAVFDALVAAGEPVGLRLAGAAAMESLRTEKGNLEYGVDLDNTDTPLHVGMGFLLAWDKPGGFIGRDAVWTVRQAGPPHTRLVRVRVHDPAVQLFGHEVLRRNGEVVGHLRYGTYGHTLGVACGQGMVSSEEPISDQWIGDGSWTLDAGGQSLPATVSLRPFHDPAGSSYRGR